MKKSILIAIFVCASAARAAQGTPPNVLAGFFDSIIKIGSCLKDTAASQKSLHDVFADQLNPRQNQSTGASIGDKLKLMTVYDSRSIFYEFLASKPGSEQEKTARGLLRWFTTKPATEQDRKARIEQLSEIAKAYESFNYENPDRDWKVRADLLKKFTGSKESPATALSPTDAELQKGADEFRLRILKDDLCGTKFPGSFGFLAQLRQSASKQVVHATPVSQPAAAEPALAPVSIAQ